MATADVLSQDEIDALLHGVDGGDVETESDEQLNDGVARGYDFNSQDRIVRGRLPTLEMINERFARNFRVSMFNLLRRQAEIAVGGVQMMKFAEYVHSLYVPTSLNMIKICWMHTSFMRTGGLKELENYCLHKHRMVCQCFISHVVLSQAK